MTHDLLSIERCWGDAESDPKEIRLGVRRLFRQNVEPVEGRQGYFPAFYLDWLGVREPDA